MWNVRGLGDIDKRFAVRDWLQAYHTNVVCLQESKLEKPSVFVLNSLNTG